MAYCVKKINKKPINKTSFRQFSETFCLKQERKGMKTTHTPFSKLVLGGLVASTFAASLLAAESQILLEDTFSSDTISQEVWRIDGDVSLQNGQVFTQSPTDEKQPFSTLRSRNSFHLPTLTQGDKTLLKLEWEMQIIRPGSSDKPFDYNDFKHGSELRIVGGRNHNNSSSDAIQYQVPLLIGADHNAIYLNLEHKFSLPIDRPAKPVKLSATFNAEATVSFTIDGVEQLQEAIPAFKTGETHSVQLRLGDYNGSNSATLFDNIKLSEITPDAEDFARQLWKFRQAQSEDRATFLTAAVSPLRKIFREARDFDLPFRASYKISAAGNESEAFQIAVLPLSGQLDNVHLEIGDLVLKNNPEIKISRDNLVWNVVDYIRTAESWSPGDRIGWWWPDILAPAKTVSVAPGTIQPFWVTVNVPADAPAGVYEGIITVRAGENDPPQDVKLSLRKYDFSLPVTSKLYTMFNFCPATWQKWYHPEAENTGKLSREENYMIYDFLLDRRITPIDYYGKANWPAPEDLQYIADRGANVIAVANAGAGWDYQEQLKHLDEYDQRYQAWKNLKNFNGLPVIYGCDEMDIVCKEEPEPLIKEIFKPYQDRYPEALVTSANPYNPAHIGTFDIWVPTTYQLDDYTPIKRRAMAGDHVFAYVCLGPGKPYSNFFVDFPAMDCRILFWEYYRSGLSGILYYALNLYILDPAFGKPDAPRWPDAPWHTVTFTNGDGYLIYPGPDGKPWSSIRLEVIRNGIEDFDYLKLLEELTNRAALNPALCNTPVVTKARELLEIPPEISSDWEHRTKDYSLLESYRNQVAESIELLSRLQD